MHNCLNFSSLGFDQSSDFPALKLENNPNLTQILTKFNMSIIKNDYLEIAEFGDT